ncbi:MAG: hypothetical protein KDA46_02880, partial [Parvularculaceae bacterium]|nr:hypothetical protein [Parvularculaceae bacterium]
AGMYLSADAPCCPVIHNSGWCWRNPGILKIPGVITVRFLAPIPPGLSRKQFTLALQQALSQAKSLPRGKQTDLS